MVGEKIRREEMGEIEGESWGVNSTVMLSL